MESNLYLAREDQNRAENREKEARNARVELQAALAAAREEIASREADAEAQRQKIEQEHRSAHQSNRNNITELTHWAEENLAAEVARVQRVHAAEIKKSEEESQMRERSPQP